MQQDVTMEWEQKLHAKDQEIKVLTESYEKRIRSMKSDIEEKEQNLEKTSDLINDLKTKCSKYQHECEAIGKKYSNYKH